jgi:hypothetical protein
LFPSLKLLSLFLFKLGRRGASLNKNKDNNFKDGNKNFREWNWRQIILERTISVCVGEAELQRGLEIIIQYSIAVLA